MVIFLLKETKQSFSDKIYELLGKGRQQAALLYSFYFQKGRFPNLEEWAEKQSFSLVESIIQLIDVQLPEISMKKEEGETIKFLLKFKDGLESESVAIPMEAGITLCVSSQVGCRRACAFCETGRMGLLRHLTTEEIISQVFIARHILGIPVRNIVFMGMGEPLDNLDQVIPAIRVLTDSAGLAFGQRRITISTSGVVDGIYRLKEELGSSIHLAISVNAPNDLIRTRLMPVNRKWNMAALKQSLIDYSGDRKETILAEYVLLCGINDDEGSALELADYLSGLPVKINLIPYNPQSNDRYAPPSQEVIEKFIAILRARGYQALLRHTKGRQIMAACGQLGNVAIGLSLRNIQS